MTNWRMMKNNTIDKNELPVLSFTDEKGLIEPKELAKHYNQLPKNCVFTFFKDVIDELLFEEKIDFLYMVHGENSFTIYNFKEYDCIIVHGIIGSSASGNLLEDLIALGVRNVVFCGGAGSLVKEQQVGKLVAVDSAIRDEGMSYHYLEDSDKVFAEPLYLGKFCNFLLQNRVIFQKGCTWTTDGFYRETKSKRDAFIKAGAITVDMEQAGMLAVSKYRNINYVGLLYCGDDVSQDSWDNRAWSRRGDIRRDMVELAVKFLDEQK